MKSYLKIALLLASGVLTAVAEDQPQWGERWTRNMVSAEKSLPDSFDPSSGKNVKWVVELGTQTYSTPVIAKGKVLVGTNNKRPRDARHKGDRSVLMCLNEKDGQLIWQLVVPKLTNSMFWDWPEAGICSPPTVQNNRVYLVSNRGEVLCLDLDGQTNGNDIPYQDEARHCVPAGAEPVPPSKMDADIIWAFDLIKECGVRQHDQAHSSILLDGNYLYVNTSNGTDDSHRHIAAPDAPSLIVLDKNTGRLVARDEEHIGPHIFHCTWSSPALAEVNGRRLVFFAGGDGVVYAFEALQQSPPSGQVVGLKRVWQFDCDPDAPKENIHRFVGNQQTSPSNIKSMPVFHQGRLYVTAGGDLWWGKNEAKLICIDAGGHGDITKTGRVWEYPLTRHCLSTPAVQDGLIFVADTAGKVHCLDAKTGRAHWVHQAEGQIWASPLVADGKVYLGTRQGDVLIFRASKAEELLCSVKLGDPINGSAVAANGALYFTTMKRLFAIQNGGAAK